MIPTLLQEGQLDLNSDNIGFSIRLFAEEEGRVTVTLRVKSTLSGVLWTDSIQLEVS